MINDRLNRKDLITFLLKDKKAISFLFILAFIVIAVLAIQYVSLLSTERQFIQDKLIEDYSNSLEITRDSYRVGLALFDELSTDDVNPNQFFDRIYRKVMDYSYLNYAVVIPALKDLHPIDQKEIEESKKSDLYLTYKTAQQAIQNQKFELAESYLLEIIQAKEATSYLVLESYNLLINNILATRGEYTRMNSFINRALFFMFYNRIKSHYLITFLTTKYLAEKEPEIKKDILLQLFLMKTMYMPDEKLNADIEILVTYYFGTDSNYYENFYSPPPAKGDRQKLAFVASYAPHNDLFFKYAKINLIPLYIIYSVNLEKLLNISRKDTYYYFMTSESEGGFPTHQNSYTLFKTLYLPWSDYKHLYAGMYIADTKLVDYISRRKYILSMTVFIIFIAIIASAFIALSAFLLKEFSLNRMKSTFISTVSHELKTPITSIQLIIETLMARYDSYGKEKTQDYLNRIFTETERLLILINNLLTYSKNERQKFILTVRDTDIVKTLTEVIEFFKIDKKNMNFVLDFSQNELHIKVDEQALKQVFFNLIDNACKYGGDNNSVVISLVPGKDDVTVSITDNGVGISADDFPHIGERFYRGKETGAIPGTGLGLSLCKDIVERHKGKLIIKSTEGKGTTVLVILPKGRE